MVKGLNETHVNRWNFLRAVPDMALLVQKEYSSLMLALDKLEESNV